MGPYDSEPEFTKYLGQPIEETDVRTGVRAMLAFYEQQRAEGVLIEEDGDMLLFEWGINSLFGPESFQVNITRQFTLAGEADTCQLSLIFYFMPTAQLRGLQRGSKWCSAPEALPQFREAVEESSALGLVEEMPSTSVDLRLEFCG